MKDNKLTIVVGVVIGAAVLVGGFLAYGMIFGGGESPYDISATITMWGFDPEDAYSSAFAGFNSIYPNVKFEYRRFTDEERYDEVLLDAMAAGRGPDIFAVQNTDLARKADKIFPLPVSMYTVQELRRDFPKTVENDFVKDGSVYALPPYVDTLALLYNRDLFNEAAVVFPPKTWQEVQDVTPQLTKYSGGGISQSAFALGGSENVENMKDVVSAMIFQRGGELIDEKYDDTLSYYVQFGQESSSVYTWDESMGNSRDAFAAEEVAAVFDYASGRDEIAGKAPFVDIGVAKFPQIDGDGTGEATFARYWGYTVSRRSRYPRLAWSFIGMLTTDVNTAEQYLARTGRPPALRSLINKYLSDEEIGIFARQALIGYAWQEPDPVRVAAVFEDMVDSILAGERPRDAMRAARAEISRLSQRNF